MAKQDIIVDVDVTGLKALDSLQNSMEGVAKASKAASKQIDKATKEIKQADRASGEASEAVEGVAAMFSRMGGAGGAAGGALESLAVTMTGPLGLAIGGAVIATGGLLLGFKALTGAISATSSAVLQYVENNKTLNAASERTKSALDELIETFGAAVVGGEGFGDVIDFIAEQFKIATQIIKDNAQGIFNTAKTVVDTLLIMVNAGLGAIAGLVSVAVAPFDFALTALRKFRIAGLTMIRGMLKELGPSLVELGFMTAESLKQQIGSVNQTLSTIPTGNFTLLVGIHDATDAAVGKVNELREVIAAVEMGALNVGTGRARGGGGLRRPPKTGPAPTDPALRFQLTPTKDRTPTPGVTAGHTAASSAALELSNSLEALSNQRADATLDRLMAKLDAAAASAATFNEISMDLGENISGALTAAFVDLAASTGQFLGAFAAGTATLSEFGDAVADMMGGLASTMGRFFIEAGAAFVAGGFVGQGIGMIAAGVALNALGGVLGGVGSGNRGSGAGAAASGAASTVAREVQRSLRGPSDNRINQTIEVVIAGRSIEPEMVNVIDQVVRLGRSRSLARRGV